MSQQRLKTSQKPIHAEEDLKQLAVNVRDRRKLRGLSQEGFAYLVGCSNKQLNNIEAARNWPSMPVYLEMCKVLGLGTPPLLEASVEGA